MADWSNYNWFWHGTKDNYPQCCIFFFMYVWHKMDRDLKRQWTSDRDGYIPCPDCLANLVKNSKLIEEVEERCHLSSTEKEIIIQRIRSTRSD